MGFKLPGKSIQSGTSAHSSALKMVAEQKAASALKAKASPAKSPEYDAAAKKDPNLASYVAERKKIKAKHGGDRKKYRASEEYKANQSKINKAYGIDDGYKAPSATTPQDGEMHAGREVGKSGTEYRPGVGVTNVTVKKNKGTGETTKSVRKFTGVDGSKGKTVIKSDKTGDLKKIKRKKTSAEGDVTKGREKYYRKGEEKGTIKKKVVKEGGRRTVTKTDREGNVTTKSRRTLKGILTGKGKKKEENSPAKQRILSAREKQIKKANKGKKDRREKKRNK